MAFITKADFKTNLKKDYDPLYQIGAGIVSFCLNIDITITDGKKSSSDFVVGLSSYFLSVFVLQTSSEINNKLNI
jgi:hypothetical protein